MAEVKPQDAPPETRTFCEKGNAALERKNYDYAMDMFEAALHIEPRLLSIRQQLRTAALENHKLNQTGKLAEIKSLGALLKIRPLIQKNPTLALESAEKLFRNAPLNHAIAKVICRCAQSMDLPEVAIQTLEHLKNHAPENLTVLEDLAELYEKTHQLNQEYACRESIARLKPNDATAQQHLKDTAARLTMKEAGWDEANSFRDITKKTDDPSSDL